MKVINFIGQPSAGKSALAGGLFYLMKSRHLNVELVTEYNKEIIYEKNDFALARELIIFAEKYKRIKRMDAQVDFVITDSALINSIFYSTEFGDIGNAFFQLVSNEFDNLYIFVERVSKYVPHGRIQTEEEADRMSEVIRNWMVVENIPFYTIKGNDQGLRDIIPRLEADGIIFSLE